MGRERKVVRAMCLPPQPLSLSLSPSWREARPPTTFLFPPHDTPGLLPAALRAPPLSPSPLSRRSHTCCPAHLIIQPHLCWVEQEVPESSVKVDLQACTHLKHLFFWGAGLSGGSVPPLLRSSWGGGEGGGILIQYLNANAWSVCVCVCVRVCVCACVRVCVCACVCVSGGGWGSVSKMH